MLRAFVTASVLAVALVGCGLTTTDETGLADKPHTLRLTKAEARSTARAMLLRASDVPEHWIPKTWRESDDNECGMHAAPRELGEAGSTFGDEETGGSVSSAAAIFRNQRQARRTFAVLMRVLTSRRGRRCFSAALRAEAEAGYSFGPIRFRPLRYRVGRSSGGVRLSIPFAVHGTSVWVHLTLFVMQERQAAAWVMTARPRKAFSRTFHLRLARRMHERMGLAQAAHDV